MTVFERGWQQTQAAKRGLADRSAGGMGCKEEHGSACGGRVWSLVAMGAIGL